MMARPSTGQVLERRGKNSTTFALRFRAYGKRHYISTTATSRRGAEEQLSNVLADVRRGIWRAATIEAPRAPQEEPTFHIYASELVARRSVEVGARTVEYFKWALSNHLLPFFATMPPSDVTTQAVKQYRTQKL